MRLRRRRVADLALGLSALVATLARPVAASEGILEINQTCAVVTGCFSGDAPGFPVTIGDSAERRSFRLASDLSIPNANTDAIFISRSGVRIDLNGFRIAGPTTCSGSPPSCSPTGTGDGVAASSLTTTSDISVHDGSITGMGRSGVDLGPRATVIGLRVSQNGLRGIGVNVDGLVQASSAVGNNTDGIVAGDGSRVRDCVSSENGDDGLQGGIGIVVSANAARANAGAGFELTSSAVVDTVVAEDNGADGVVVGVGSTISDCSTWANGDDGISAGSGTSIRGCTTVENAGDGISTASGVFVSRIVSRGNAQAQLRLGNASSYAESVLNITTQPATGQDLVLVNGTSSSSFRNAGDNFCTTTFNGLLSEASCP